MPLVKATCTNCGAALEVDSAKEAAVCPYCNTAYIVEKAINNYALSANNIIINQFSADPISLLEADLKRAETNINLGEWSKAEQIYKQALEQYPGDARVWLGLIDANTMSCSKRLTYGEYQEVRKISKKIVMLKPKYDYDKLMTYLQKQRDLLIKAESAAYDKKKKDIEYEGEQTRKFLKQSIIFGSIFAVLFLGGSIITFSASSMGLIAMFRGGATIMLVSIVPLVIFGLSFIQWGTHHKNARLSRQDAEDIQKRVETLQSDN